MTTFNLTNVQDTFTGGTGTDIFQGPGGGADVLNGNAGNDFFFTQIGQTGSINGGAGYDFLYLTGPGFNNELDSSLTITGVEELIVDATNLFATAAQLKGFHKFDVNNSSDEFHFFLQGAGGALNFSDKYFEPQKLSIEAELTTSAVQIIGSTKSDDIIGSDFNDRISGDNGNDTLRGGAGGDLISGGLGADYLYGDDGRDQYVFDTALGGTNIDHFGDFRPVDDTIRLDHTIFSHLGQTTGVLTDSHFKVIGTGQTVDADDRIIYNQATGALYYDADGSGSGGPIKFAIADNFSGDIPVLTHNDFIVV